MQCFLVFNGPNRFGAKANNSGCLELEPEPENLSFGSMVPVPTTANLGPGFHLQVFKAG